MGESKILTSRSTSNQNTIKCGVVVVRGSILGLAGPGVDSKPDFSLQSLIRLLQETVSCLEACKQHASGGGNH